MTKSRTKLIFGSSILTDNKFALLFSIWFNVILIFSLISKALVVQAGFWTFYLPNVLKPTGFSELTTKIDFQEQRFNTIKDNFADIQYFWGLMQDFDKIDPASIYPEDSACAELFPMFRDLAIEYSYIDYNLYLTPIEEYHKQLLESRAKWFPAGPASKATLPREWEQELYQKEMELKIEWHSRLTEQQEYIDKRERLLEIWKTAKRSLDTSLQCVYLKYAYRQMAEDINQLALETNLKGMKTAIEMIRSAYKRIENFKHSDQRAMDQIAKEIKKEEIFKIEQ